MGAAPRALDFERDGQVWPNRDASRFVRAGGLRWHVQVAGQGPPMLLVHGTGAATHSWRGLLPLLAAHFTVIAPDLPGHGFTEMPSSRRLSITGMVRALQTLLWTLELEPTSAIGHSAGAPVLVRMTVDGQLTPRALVGINGALLPLSGAAGQIFSPLAKLLVGLPGLPQLFAWRARDPKTVRKLLESTGSRVDDTMTSLYGRVVREPTHAAAALGMMANWDLPSMLPLYPRLEVPFLLIAGANDRTVPPAQSEQVAAMVEHGTFVSMPGLGHLSHEEDPSGTAAIIFDFAHAQGVL